MLGTCRQTCVCRGRSQGKTRALVGRRRRERTEDQGRGWAGDNVLAVGGCGWTRWKGRGRCHRGWDVSRQGQCLLFWDVSAALLAPSYLRAPWSQPHLPLHRGSPAGIGINRGLHWSYWTNEMDPQNVCLFLGKRKGGELQLNSSGSSGNLYRVERFRMQLSTRVHAIPKTSGALGSLGWKVAVQLCGEEKKREKKKSGVSVFVFIPVQKLLLTIF